jgi:hypothetical protein
LLTFNGLVDFHFFCAIVIAGSGSAFWRGL